VLLGFHGEIGHVLSLLNVFFAFFAILSEVAESSLCVHNLAGNVLKCPLLDATLRVKHANIGLHGVVIM